MTNHEFREETKLILRRLTDAGYMLDMRKGAHKDLDVSETALQRILNEMCDIKHIKMFYIPMEQNGRKIHVRTITKPDVKFIDVMSNIQDILTFNEASARLEKRNERARKVIAEQASREAKKFRRTKEDIKDMVFEMRDLKRNGLSNVQIGTHFGVNESTVRRHLKKPLTSVELLIEMMREAVKNGQTEISRKVINSEEFLNVFGRDYGPGYFVRVKNVKAEVEIREGVTADSFESMSFKLEFIATKIKDNR